MREPDRCEVLGGGVHRAWDQFDGSVHSGHGFATGAGQCVLQTRLAVVGLYHAWCLWI